MEDLFSDAVRQLLSDRCTPDVVRAIEAGGSCAGLWGHLEDAGYADALVPESAGGAGMGLGDLYAVLELCGEFALPVPLGETLLARGVLSSAGVTPPRGTMSFGNGRLTLERLICGAVQGAKVSEWILVNCSGDYRVLPPASAELQASGFCLNAHLEWPLDIWEAASKVPGAWDLQAARSSCMTTFLKTARNGAILILTMSQPETRNALTGNTAADEFVQACETIRRDLSVRVVILTAEGPVFSSGGNVKDTQRYEALKPMPDVIREEYGNGIQRIPGALYNLDVPVIAAINGPAIGAGLDLTCMCDIRIASEKATFAESFVKVGIVPGDGGAWLLPRAVGMSKASEMAFTGEALDAAQALACGLVSRVVPPDARLEQAMSLARKIAANPGGVLRMTKRLLREGERSSLESLLELSAGYQAIAHMTPDHHGAVRAFVEKRAPKFSG